MEDNKEKKQFTILIKGANTNIAAHIEDPAGVDQAYVKGHEYRLRRPLLAVFTKDFTYLQDSATKGGGILAERWVEAPEGPCFVAVNNYGQKVYIPTADCDIHLISDEKVAECRAMVKGTRETKKLD